MPRERVSRHCRFGRILDRAVPQKAVPRRALAFFAVLALAGFTPFVLQAWRDWRAFHDFRETRCTVLAAGYTESIGNHERNEPAPVRRHPELSLRYGNHFAYGFDNMNGRLAGMSDGSRFRIGETYPCWVDPSDEQHAIVVRKLQPKFYALALIPAFMLFVIAGMMRSGRPRERKAERGFGELRPDFTARSRITTGVVIVAVFTAITGGVIAWVVYAERGWFLIVLFLAAEVGLVRRLLRFIRARGLAEPKVRLDDDAAHVTLDSRVRLDRLTIELVDEDERTMLYEAENVVGNVQQRLEVGSAGQLVVTQRFGGTDVATEFALE